MTAAIEVFEVLVDGCKHYASVQDLAAAQDLARWCHARGYCYDTRPPEPGQVLVITTRSGNQPPREVHDTVTVLGLVPSDDADRTVGRTHHVLVEYSDGRKRQFSSSWLARHARRPLDPTPPGLPPTGEQLDLFDLLEATP